MHIIRPEAAPVGRYDADENKERKQKEKTEDDYPPSAP
jgi:hypothetical protein